MVLDVSKWQGLIDWKKAFSSGENIEGVIIRAGVQDGGLDPYFKTNLDNIMENLPLDRIAPGKFLLDIYKFSYARKYGDAFIECADLIEKVRTICFPDMFEHLWLDLEKWNGKDYTTSEANDVIKGYLDAAKANSMRLGLYCNYHYVKNIIDSRWSSGLPLWVARYNSQLGDVSPWKPYLWQYTSSGKVPGITGNVDLSRYM